MRIPYRAGRALAAVLLILLAPAALANAREQLDRFLDGLDSMQARFVQTVQTENGTAGPFEGSFYLKRPGLFRWDYDGKEGQLIVADGKRVWLLDRELEQVSHQAQETALRGTPAQLLAERGNVEEYFTLADGGVFDGLTWIDLVPKEEESQFAELHIGFDGEQLARIEMADKFGQYTRFVFNDVERNPSLDPKLFRFEAPPGWDVFQTH